MYDHLQIGRAPTPGQWPSRLLPPSVCWTLILARVLSSARANAVATIFQIWQCSGNKISDMAMQWQQYWWRHYVDEVCALLKGSNYLEVSDCWPWTVNKGLDFCSEQSPSGTKQWLVDEFVNEWVPFSKALHGFHGSLLFVNWWTGDASKYKDFHALRVGGI